MRYLPFALFLFPSLAWAQIPTLTLDAVSETAPALESPPVAQEPAAGITGDWGGARTALAQRGYSFAGLAQMDISRNFRGGLDTEKTVFRYLLDLNLTIDGGKAFNLPGSTFFVDLQNHDGADGSARLIGDAQGFNTLDGPHFFAIAQLWYEQKFCDDKLSVKVGKIDANADFSVIEHGLEFQNASFFYTTAMYPMASYPDSAAGVEVFFRPSEAFYVGAGTFYNNRDNSFLVFVGDPAEKLERSAGGMFYIGEVGTRWNCQKDRLAGHAALGAWAHNGRFPEYSAHPAAGSETLETGTGGGYALVDQTIWQSEEGGREIGVFANYGYSDPARNPVTQQAGGGVAMTGPFSWRAEDMVGVGVTWAQLGHTPEVAHNFEVAFDGFYRVQLMRGVAVKPDLQYIVNPGGAGRDALVLTVRFEVAF